MSLTDKQKQVIQQFVEEDVIKFGGMLHVYIKMIELEIPFVEGQERKEGMAIALGMLQDGVDKAEAVLDMVQKGEWKALEKALAEERLPRHQRKKMDAEKKDLN